MRMIKFQALVKQEEEEVLMSKFREVDGISNLLIVDYAALGKHLERWYRYAFYHNWQGSID